MNNVYKVLINKCCIIIKRMASYPPPTGSINIYNNIDFLIQNTSITIDEADTRYIKRSNGSALNSTTFNGGLESNGSVHINKSDSNVFRVSNDDETVDVINVNSSNNQTVLTDGLETRPSLAFDSSVATGLTYRHGLSLISDGDEKMNVEDFIQPRVQILTYDASHDNEPQYSYGIDNTSGLCLYDSGVIETSVGLVIQGEASLQCKDMSGSKYIQFNHDLHTDDSNELKFYHDISAGTVNSRIFCDGGANLTLESQRSSADISLKANNAIYGFIGSTLRTSTTNTNFSTTVPVSISANSNHISLVDSGNSNKIYTLEHDNNNVAFVEQGLGYPFEIRGGSSSASFAGQVLFNPGLESAPGLSFRTGRSVAPYNSANWDSDTGIYRIGADNLGISCGGKNIMNLQQSNSTVTSSEFIHRPLNVTDTTVDTRVQRGNGLSYEDVLHLDETRLLLNVPLQLPNSSSNLSNYHTYSYTPSLQNDSSSDFLSSPSTIGLTLTRIGSVVTCSITTEPTGTVASVTTYCKLGTVIDSIYRPSLENTGFISLIFGGTFQPASVAVGTDGNMYIYMDSGRDLFTTTAITIKRSTLSWTV